jgi:serine/threonine protein kinase
MDAVTSPRFAAAGVNVDADVDIGKVLDSRYGLVARLGGSAHADVWRATDERLGRQVAIRLFHPGALDPVRAPVQLALLARVTHPGLLTVLDAGVDGDGDDDDRPAPRTYLVTELVTGSTLRDELVRGPLPSAALAHIGLQLANALVHAHSHGLAHGRISSGNIVVMESAPATEGMRPRVKLADVGVVDLYAHAGTATSGTEDIRALGYVLLEALTGPPAGAGIEGSIAASGPRWGRLLSGMINQPASPATTAREVAVQLGTLISEPDASAPYAGTSATAGRRNFHSTTSSYRAR